ncbi:uncharacterized protein LOC129580891 [Paramacrobiotus metropolitanus]|uniref:uncharacterized protein LOC129580891 n=1 Tax=Paramacrobiotus metropolitanus TaxID=2943436 RepID=UPI00244560A7|nr:uncharacterized protein LOC129580891 [Paramacrobiotus metropolitanus]
MHRYFIYILLCWATKLSPMSAQFSQFGMTNVFNLTTQPTPAVMMETCGDAFSKFAFVPLSAKENHEVGRLVDFDGGPGWEPFRIISGNEKGLFKMDKEGILRTAYQIFDVDIGDYPLRLASINGNMICTVLINIRIGANASLFDSFTRNHSMENNAIMTFATTVSTRATTTTRLPVTTTPSTTIRTTPTTTTTSATTTPTTVRTTVLFTLPPALTTTTFPPMGFANLLSPNNSRILLDDFDVDLDRKNGSKRQFTTQNFAGTPLGGNPALGTFPLGPRCADPFLTVAVPADTPPSVLITKVTATYEVGVPIVYTIPDVVFDRFRVDAGSGEIFTGPAPLSTRPGRQFKKGSVIPQTRSALEFRVRGAIPNGAYCETVIRVNVVPTVFQANPTPAPLGGRNPPFFISQNLNFPVTSCIPGTVIGRVEALDPDAGDRVQYAIDNPTSEVVIDAGTGILRVGSIPPTVQQIRQVTVRAIDLAALSSTTLVIVNFQCRSATFPTPLQFSQGSYQFVTTNCAIGTAVGNVMILGSPFGVSFQSSAPQEFIIDPSGGIRIATPALFGLNFQRTITVIATDPRGSQGQTTVNIIGRCSPNFGAAPLDPDQFDQIDRSRFPTGPFPPINRPGTPPFFDSRSPAFPPPLGADRNPSAVSNFNINPNIPPPNTGNVDNPFNMNGGPLPGNPGVFPGNSAPFPNGNFPPGAEPNANGNLIATGPLTNPNIPMGALNNPGFLNGPFGPRLPNRQLAMDQPDAMMPMNNRDPGLLRPVFPNTASFIPGSGQFDLIVKVPFINNSVPDNRLMDGFSDLEKFHQDDISASEKGQPNQKGITIEAGQDPEDPNAVVFSAKQLNNFGPNSAMLGQNQIFLPPNQMIFPSRPESGGNFPPFQPVNPFPVMVNPQLPLSPDRPAFGPSIPNFLLPNNNFPALGGGRPDFPMGQMPQNGPRPFAGPPPSDPSRFLPGPISRPYGVGGQFTELTIQLPSSAGQTPPVFLTPLCAPPSTNFIGRVQAVDPDPVDRVSYFIWSTGGTDVFDVNAVTGEIRSRVALGLGTYNVDVAARDLSGRTAIMKLEITISPSCPLQTRINNNFNANPIINPDLPAVPDVNPFSFGNMGGPRFAQPNFRFSLPPFAPPRTMIGQIQASSSDGSRIVYSLTPAGPEFDIDLDGRVFALMPVDGVRNLQVTATDAMGRSSATSINIVNNVRAPGQPGPPASLPVCLHNDQTPNNLKKSLQLSHFPVVNHFGIIRQSSKSGLAIQGATVITVDAPYEGTLPASLPSGTILGEYSVTGGSGIYRWLPGSNSNFEIIGEGVGTLQTRMTLQPGAYEYRASIKDNAGNLGSIDIQIIVRNPDFGESLAITPEISPMLNRQPHDSEFHNLLDKDQTVLF